MGERVKVVLPEFRKSEHTHVGKSGVLAALDQMTGRAKVRSGDGETMTIDACCLQQQDDSDSQ